MNIALQDDLYKSDLISNQLNTMDRSSAFFLNAKEIFGLMPSFDYNNPSSVSTSPIPANCIICNDRSTGRHYGAASCDGCKGFFRRSVRKSHVYQCRFQRACNVVKDKRNQCRYCRLKKCFKAGMRRDAVQNERDRISVKRPPVDHLSSNSILSISTLHQAFLATDNLRQSTAEGGEGREASPCEVIECLREQLVVLVEWVRLLPVFSQLPLTDQVLLLRWHTMEILLLSLARRSSGLRNCLLLCNGCQLSDSNCDSLFPTRELSQAEEEENSGQWSEMENNHAQFSGISAQSGPLGGVKEGQGGLGQRGSLKEIQNNLVAHLVNHLVRPFAELRADSFEMACLMAITLFDPNCPGLSESTRIRQLRWQIQVSLEDATSDRQYDERGRFGEMLFFINSLSSVATRVRQTIADAAQNHNILLDNLLIEMIFNENIGDSKSQQTDVIYSEHLQPTNQLYENHVQVPAPSPNYVSPIFQVDQIHPIEYTNKNVTNLRIPHQNEEIYLAEQLPMTVQLYENFEHSPLSSPNYLETNPPFQSDLNCSMEFKNNLYCESYSSDSSKYSIQTSFYKVEDFDFF